MMDLHQLQSLAILLMQNDFQKLVKTVVGKFGSVDILSKQCWNN